jgi:gluconolactonase
LTFWIAVVVAATVSSVAVRAQMTGGTSFTIERLDPALDEIVSPDAALETLGDRFALTEGPVWVPEGQDGYLLFSDYSRDSESGGNGSITPRSKSLAA